ncbi:MAG TPA: methyltransferase domain-containing protein [Polyangia bacterium]|jgi:SAM-dependent methyltransferase|nr:methyltransferase domain-containing protein [Polyangia bacterium]
MTEKQERLVKAYDSEAWPLYGARFAEMVSRVFSPRPASRVLVLGAATGTLPLALARTVDSQSRLVTFETSPTLATQARRRVESDPATAARIFVGDHATVPFPFGAAGFDNAIWNGGAGEGITADEALSELTRALRPGGQLIAALPLRGTWAELLDIFRGVLRDNRKTESVAALDRYLETLLEGDAPAAALERAGLRDVQMTVERWELLFKSAREFFFAPVIELLPLARWKAIAGRGDEMQDIFFFIKEAIDAYFAGGVFAVSVVAGCVTGTKV